MAARVLVVVAAIAVVVFGVTQARRADRCATTRDALIAAGFHHRTPPGGFPASLRTFTAACDSPEDRQQISTLLTVIGRHGQALALARRTIRDAPQAQAGWAALAQALDGSDPAGARSARARVAVLNPRAVVPAAPPVRFLEIHGQAANP